MNAGIAILTMLVW